MAYNKQEADRIQRQYFKNLYEQLKNHSEFTDVHHYLGYRQLEFKYHNVTGKLIKEVEYPYNLLLFYLTPSKDGVHKFYAEYPKLSKIQSYLNSLVY